MFNQRLFSGKKPKIGAAQTSSKVRIGLIFASSLSVLLLFTALQAVGGNDLSQPLSEPIVIQQPGIPGPDPEELEQFPSGPDPDLEPGFPVQTYHGTGTYHTGQALHTLVGNIDNDPTLEILVTGLAQGPLYAWNSDGSLVSGWPVSSVPGAGYMGLGELDINQPGLEVFVGTMASGGGSNADKVAALTGGGVFLNGWPFPAGNYVETSPALADVDGDGIDEIFIGEDDYNLYAYEPDGTLLPNWPRNGGGGQDRHTPAIVDLDQDGDLEIITTSGAVTSGVWIHAWHHDGTRVNGWPIVYPNYGYTDTYLAVGDVDGDGGQEVVFMAKGLVQVVSADGVVERTLTPSGGVGVMPPALADLDGDSFPEIVFKSAGYIDIWYGDGTNFPGWPISGTGGRANTAPVIGDVNGDYVPDIVIANSAVRAYSLDGNLLPNFPKSPTNFGTGAVPAIADIDLDGHNEIIVTGVYWNGTAGFYDKVWAYDLGGPPHGPILWGQFGNNERNQGFAATTIPISGLVAINSSPVAISETVAFTASTTSGNNLHFTWSFGDGQTGGGPNISHTYDAAGMYTAVVTASNSMGYFTETTTVIVDEAVSGLTASNDGPTTLGQPTAFTATVTTGSNLTYTWDFGDGTTGSGAVVQHLYPGDGLYTATVTAANSINQEVAETAVQVESSIIGLTATNSGPTPFGQSTNFTATVTAGSNLIYVWNFGDGATGTGQFTGHTYAGPGLYTATVTATNVVDMASATTLVVVEQWSVYMPVIIQPMSTETANYKGPILFLFVGPLLLFGPLPLIWARKLRRRI